MEIIDRWAKLINSFEAGQSVQIASYTRSRGVRDPRRRDDGRDRRQPRPLPARLQPPRPRQTRIRQPQHQHRQDPDRHRPRKRRAGRRRDPERPVQQPRQPDALHRRMQGHPARPRAPAAPHGRGAPARRGVPVRRTPFRASARQARHQGPRVPVEHRRAQPDHARHRIPGLEIPAPHHVGVQSAAGTVRPAGQRPDRPACPRRREHPPRAHGPRRKHDARAPQERRGQDAGHGPAAQEPQAGPRPRRPSRRPRRPAGTARPAARRAALHQPEARGLDHRDRSVHGKPGGAGGRVQEREGQGQRAVLHGREPQVHADGGTDGRAAAGQQPSAHEADPDHEQRGHPHPVHHAGGVRAARPVLRKQREERQPDPRGPAQPHELQRIRARHVRRRQILHRQTGDRRHVPQP